jgi:hypothetical protein
MSGHNDSDSGARKILESCLGLKMGHHNLLLFSDETTLDVTKIFLRNAAGLDIPATAIFVPVEQQQAFKAGQELSLPLLSAAREARAILTCLNASPDCLEFRDQLLHTQWSARTRIGHMPGVNEDVLRIANINFHRQVADCERLAVALGRGKRLELLSYDRDGQAHTLYADLGGWERLPVSSSGVIQDGSWGNVPSGETYIAPIEGTAWGAIVIDGSLPGMVVQPGQAAILHFEHGCLVKIDPPDGPLAAWLEESQIARARLKGDAHWSNLAEIGIGVNPAVKHLTGNMLFDEKMAGTVHIALGSNRYMGGQVDASIHCDLVTQAPSLRIDGKSILERGRNSLVDADWRQSYRSIDPAARGFSLSTRATRSGVRVEETREGRLRRLLHSEPGIVTSCLIGDDETAQLAFLLYDYLPIDGRSVSAAELAGLAGLPVGLLLAVLAVMDEYNLLIITP